MNNEIFIKKVIIEVFLLLFSIFVLENGKKLADNVF